MKLCQETLEEIYRSFRQYAQAKPKHESWRRASRLAAPADDWMDRLPN